VGWSWSQASFHGAGQPDAAPGFSDARRRTAKRFLHEYQSQLRTFEEKHEVAPEVLVTRTGGHTPGHSVVRPTAWAWASRSAARLSKPIVGGCGRPGASRGVLSFSLRSPLTEPPSVIDVAYWPITDVLAAGSKVRFLG
jgi:hypothetical protein